MSLEKSPVYRQLIDKSNKRNRKVGAEIERLVVDSDHRIAQYSSHIQPLFRELIEKKNWNLFYEESGAVLALEKSGNYITLEPGAQLEISGGPVENLRIVKEVEAQIEQEILSCQTAKGWSFLFLGMNPYNHPQDIELIPSPRYKIMTEYFPKKARRGLEMMRLTTGFHLNLDYYTESEAMSLLRASTFLSPYIVAAFCNSPYAFNRRASNLSERLAVWQETDPVRCGPVEFVLDSNANFSDYVNLVSNTELMYYLDENGRAYAAEGKSLNDLSEELQALNAISAMRQLFTDVRLKPCCVEIRGFDQMAPEMRYAAMSFCVGLIYDEENCNKLNDLALQVNAAKIRALTQEGLAHGMADSEIYEQIRSFFEMAKQGLVRRGQGEEDLIAPMEVLLSKKQTPAEILIETGIFKL